MISDTVATLIAALVGSIVTFIGSWLTNMKKKAKEQADENNWKNDVNSNIKKLNDSLATHNHPDLDRLTNAQNNLCKLRESEVDNKIENINKRLDEFSSTSKIVYELKNSLLILSGEISNMKALVDERINYLVEKFEILFEINKNH